MNERESLRFYCGVCGEDTRTGIAWHCDGCGAHHPVRFLACEFRGRDGGSASRRQAHPAAVGGSVMGIFRTPPEESADLYPGLVVHDGRVTGSITAGATRLPLWAFVSDAVNYGWEWTDPDYDITGTGLTKEAFGWFLYNLLELRGEFGRLLLTLANAERLEDERFGSDEDRPWYYIPAERERVIAQLRRCVAALEAE